MKNIIVFLALILAGCASLKNSISPQRSIIGQWRCLSATVDSKPLNDKKVSELRLTLTRDRYKTEDAKEVLFDSVYSINTAAIPAQITLIGTEGNLTGKEAKGIFEISGDLLLLCYAMPGKPRPTSFQSLPGSGAHFIVWKRNKP